MAGMLVFRATGTDMTSLAFLPEKRFSNAINLKMALDLIRVSVENHVLTLSGHINTRLTALHSCRAIHKGNV